MTMLSYKNFLQIIFCIFLAFFFCSCQSSRVQPEYLGDVETQETTHQFSTDYDTIFSLTKSAYKELGLVIKKSDQIGRYMTASKNHKKEYVTSTSHFYPMSEAVRVRIVTTSNSRNPDFTSLSESVIQLCEKGIR